MLIKTCKIFILLFSLTFAADVAYRFYKKKKKKKKEIMREINEAIMFSHGTGELKRSKYSRCMVTHAMDRLLYYMNSPHQSIDICMYVFTNLDICTAIMKLHHRGVVIRIIVDADMAFATNSYIKKLERHGIPVRWMKSTNLMHHKFCVIDGGVESASVLPFLITGSLNWTNQALSGNWENVLVTSQKDLVNQYWVEFERLWVLFKPIVAFK